MKLLSQIAFFLFTTGIGNLTFACTSFLLNGNNRHIVGKNYDWSLENGRVLVNKHGASKTAFGVKNPISWQSKYGSITFNQYGQEFPNGGMNETGLVIEALWLNETVYPPLTDSMPQIDNMQWIQYQLDISATVDDVINNDKIVQIRPISPTAVHYFIADKNGKSLIIEAVGGMIHRYLPDSANPPLLTNDPYDKSIRLLQKCSAFGGTLEIPKGEGSISRFIRTAVHTKKDASRITTDPIDYSFKTLNDARIFLLTKWSITYDLDRLVVYFKSTSSSEIKSVELNRMNFNCSEPVQFVDIRFKKKGDISDKFNAFTTQENFSLIKESISKTDFLKSSGLQLIPLIADFQQTITCSNK